jgi:hypothetical protein
VLSPGHGLGGAEQLPIVGLADHDVGGREVAEDQRAGERGGRRRRGRRPDVLADLRGEAEVRQIRCRIDQVGPERDLLAGQVHCQAGDTRAGREPAILIEFPIVGQETFGRDSEDPAAGDHHRAIVERAAMLHRRADDQHRRKVAAGGGQALDLGLHPPQQGVLQEEVVDGVGREPQLRKQHQVAAARMAFPGQGQGLDGVEPRVADRHRRRAGRDPHEAVAVDRVERLGPGFRHSGSPFIPQLPKKDLALATDLSPGRNAHFEHI